ncbi:hypothetical protein [Jannaschia aquimarina]|uniref:Antifreeze glycopeptide polyprotein n=1 Tax=Jannaschia aquimarina TaxID=935700 RepID=A0A0D1D7I0_9RHOB|nr:hypothetical protein [Jannaschia aquimarina]KIT15933.1 hypothetical protein jaqu_22010 [Jannaschia aquimarina]SNS98135.1 hypothetical protein SAMN05421775_104112 [Jannaschia aquimarina]
MRANLFLVVAACLATPSFAQQPDTVIPWLREALNRPPLGEAPDEPPASAPSESDVAVLPLGEVRRDAVGLLGSDATGLPPDAVAGSEPDRLADLLSRPTGDMPPALQGIVRLLLLAELNVPRAATDPDSVFHARIDALVEVGALDPAQALLERAGADTPETFARLFDVALMTGYDEEACATMLDRPDLAPGLPARIYCLSRSGDWQAAALALETGRALQVTSPEEDLLLARFLDPELFEGEPPPIPPRPMTPLAFRLLEGMGERPATRDLPLRFAGADLSPTSGWKAQIEAAERLARAGAISADSLFALYTERRPSASGGVWERASAVARLERALASGADPAGELRDAVALMEEADLLDALAAMIGERVVASGVSGDTALRLGLLSPAYETAAANARTSDPRLAFAAALARGEALPPLAGDLPAAIASAFAPQAVTDDELARMAQSDRIGEAMLEVATSLSAGSDTPPRDVTRALAFLRSVGMEDRAKRTALHLLLAG